MKIIVLSKASYQEKDVIVNAIKEDGYFSFTVKGGLNPTNPFKWLNNPLTVAEIEFVEPNIYKYPILKRAELISSPMTSNQSFNELVSVSAVSEIIMKMLQDEEKHLIFNDVIEFLDSYKKENVDVLMMLIIFFGRSFKYAGLELEANKCVNCGSKENIVAFSFEEGGFLCKNCIDSGTQIDLSSNQMRLIRYALLAPMLNVNSGNKFSEADKKVVIAKMNAFANDITGVEIESINLLVK